MTNKHENEVKINWREIIMAFRQLDESHIQWWIKNLHWSQYQKKTSKFLESFIIWWYNVSFNSRYYRWETNELMISTSSYWYIIKQRKHTYVNWFRKRKTLNSNKLNFAKKLILCRILPLSKEIKKYWYILWVGQSAGTREYIDCISGEG